MSIADRAIQAYEAQTKAEEATREAAIARSRAYAIEAIGRKADVFGLGFDADDLEQQGSGTGAHSAWRLSIPVDTDANLVFEWKKRDAEPEVEVWLTACDQLYWDLPPGEETKGPGGGTYACYGLRHDRMIETLADLGSAILSVRKAREMWKKKHCFKDPSG